MEAFSFGPLLHLRNQSESLGQHPHSEEKNLMIKLGFLVGLPRSFFFQAFTDQFSSCIFIQKREKSAFLATQKLV